MQSLASLMSVKPSDIGNLDDFPESDEESEEAPKQSWQADGAGHGVPSKGGASFPFLISGPIECNGCLLKNWKWDMRGSPPTA